MTVAPDSIPDLPEPMRIRTLVDLWNLCESAAELPTWAYTYISGQACNQLNDIRTLKEFIERESSIVFSHSGTARGANWAFCNVLNTRSLDSNFLPGNVFLLAPNVAAVKDRRASAAIAVVFREHAEPYPIGPFSADNLVPYTDPTPLRAVPAKNGIKVGNATVELPFITDVLSCGVSSAGFCICSAPDSQRLWIIRAG
jgi:hypothetical protein